MRVDTQLSRHAYYLVREGMNEHDGNYFEIGVFYGAGFFSMADHYRERKCYAVDPFIEDGCTTGHSKVEAGELMLTQKESTLAFLSALTNTELFIMTSHEFKDQLTAQQITDMDIRTVLIDGNHSYDCASNDYKLALQLIGDKAGSIIFDDTDISGVKQAFNEFCSENQERIVSMDRKVGEAVLVMLKNI
jgi:hypothetical protein